MLPILVLAQEASPKSTINSYTLSVSCFSDRFSVSLAAKRKHSRGVNVPSNASYCITYPIWFEYGYNEAIVCEFILIYPAIVKLSDTSRDDKKLSNVVLPEPDGPRIAVKLSA